MALRTSAAKILTQVLMVFLVLLVLLDALLLFTSPWWLHALSQSGPVDVENSAEYMFRLTVPADIMGFTQAFVALSGVALGCLLVEGIRLLRSVPRGMPFCRANTRSLFRAGCFALAQMALFLAKMVYDPSILTLGCVGVFLIGAMLLFVLAELFHSAALLKEDSELTI